MVAIFQTKFSNSYFEWIYLIPIKICRLGDKPLFESVMTYFTDAYMRRLVSMR